MLVRNISTGPRGAYLNGVLVWADRGEVIEADDFPDEWFALVRRETEVSVPAGGDPSNDVIHATRAGLALTEIGGGWWQISGGSLKEPVKVRGEDAARTKFDELTA